MEYPLFELSAMLDYANESNEQLPADYLPDQREDLLLKYKSLLVFKKVASLPSDELR